MSLDFPWIRATLILNGLGWTVEEIAQAVDLEEYENSESAAINQIQEVIDTNGHPSWLKGREIVQGEVIASDETRILPENGQGPVSPENRSEDSTGASEGERPAGEKILSMSVLPRLALDKQGGL